MARMREVRDVIACAGEGGTDGFSVCDDDDNGGEDDKASENDDVVETGEVDLELIVRDFLFPSLHSVLSRVRLGR